MTSGSAFDMPTVRHFRPFLGYTEAQWYDARTLFKDLGFKENWAHEVICEIDTGTGRFLAARNMDHDPKRAGMMHLWVESVDDWWAHIEPMKLNERYAGVKVAEPALMDWDWRILFLWDPGGWLWHIGEPNDPNA